VAKLCASGRSRKFRYSGFGALWIQPQYHVMRPFIFVFGCPAISRERTREPNERVLHEFWGSDLGNGGVCEYRSLSCWKFVAFPFSVESNNCIRMSLPPLPFSLRKLVYLSMEVEPPKKLYFCCSCLYVRMYLCARSFSSLCCLRFRFVLISIFHLPLCPRPPKWALVALDLRLK